MLSSSLRRALIVGIVASTALLSGCAVVAVTGAVVGTATTAAGLAVDATVGTAKVVGKVVTAPF